MKKLLITLFVAFSAMFASNIFASGPALIICGDYAVGWGENCKNPNARRYDPNINYNNGGYGGYNGGGSVSIWNQSEYGNSQYGNRPYPAGGYNNLAVVGYEEGTRPCTPQEEASRRHGYAVVGGVLGAGYGARENRNEAGRLGLIGVAVGELLGVAQSIVSDCTVPVRRPVYAQRQSGNTGYMQQSSYRGQPQTKEVASRCVVNGKVRRGLTEEECDELALALSKTKTVSATEKVSVNTTEIKTERATETSATKNCPAGKTLVRMLEDIEPLKIKKGDEKCVSSQYKDDKRHIVVN